MTILSRNTRLVAFALVASLSAPLAFAQSAATAAPPAEQASPVAQEAAAQPAQAAVAPAKKSWADVDAASRDWVRGRIQKELGKVADLEGDRTRAVAAYREAERLCRSEDDDACTKDLKTLIRRGYRTGGSR